MDVESVIHRLSGYVALFRAHYFTGRNKPANARCAFDKAKARIGTRLDFQAPFDARICILEGRHAEARNRLRECVATLEDRSDDEASYIVLWCQHYLRLYEGSSQAQILKTQTYPLSPPGHIPRFLPFLEDEDIARIIRTDFSALTGVARAPIIAKVRSISYQPPSK
ncbi:hypothetical protein KYN89_08570 [Alteriqipengyuania sp. NZ-12B]|uniref:Uncharacterized protein n=1 Tax=Alteriqipengyuania abyssalis TaxID=2860200 RepID=A0ABS7PH01_9SPHN|nr:hypothetical protein [Alteriqipengyuania abyssalis]MBY8337102.1 hypothetical protein [Alteriqipengyuania abyssalis]